jgi:RimJ/RimL family protein N-acetyltransferase
VIRPMRTFEESDCRAIFRECHPRAPQRAPRWFEAHPTLVAVITGDEVVGYTSYSLVMQPDVSREGEVMIGYGIDIKPGFHGQGYGKALCAARLEVARVVGAKVFVGHATPDNKAMIRLFESDGFRPVQEVPNATEDGEPLVIYMGPIR